MTCRDFEDGFHDLLEPEGGARLLELATHAAGCGACAASEESYRAIVKLQKRSASRVPPQDPVEVELLVVSILSSLFGQRS